MHIPHLGNDRSRAIDAVDVLNDLLSDFITGTMVFRNGREQFRTGKLPVELLADLQRMCVATIVLAFAKYEEFYKHYSTLIPHERKSACKELMREISVRRIKSFRDRVVGHVWIKRESRPLKHSEVMSMLDAMVQSDFDLFLNWINSPKGNVFPGTVVSIIETIRDEIAASFEIVPTEITDR